MRITTGDRKLATAFAGPRDFFAARATGNHLSAQNDEPEPSLFSEDELIAADRNRNVDKAAALQARDEDALQLQVHRLRAEGLL